MSLLSLGSALQAPRARGESSIINGRKRSFVEEIERIFCICLAVKVFFVNLTPPKSLGHEHWDKLSSIWLVVTWEVQKKKVQFKTPPLGGGNESQLSQTGVLVSSSVKFNVFI